MSQALGLGFLASHGGSNMQAVLDACAAGMLAARPCVVISNNSEAYALERARLAGLAWRHLSSRTHRDPAALDEAICATLMEHDVELVLLLGFLKRLGPRTLAQYAGRILNIHPALLPRYGGQGMFGESVHQAVLDAGDPETGVTIHLVDARYDQGPIVAQGRVPVLAGDTASSLAERVLETEHTLLVATLRRIVAREINLAALSQELLLSPPGC
jgi:phosphoribosylglycinamide formyltransferase 1